MYGLRAQAWWQSSRYPIGGNMQTGTQLLDQEKLRSWGEYIKSLPDGDLKTLEITAYDAFHDEAERISQRGVHDGCYGGLTSWYHYVGKSGLAIKASYTSGLQTRPARFSRVMGLLKSHDRPWSRGAAEIMQLVYDGKTRATYNPELIYDKEKASDRKFSITAHQDRVEWDFQDYLWGLMYHHLEILVMGNCIQGDDWGAHDICMKVLDVSDTPSGSMTFEDMGIPEPIPGVGFSLKCRSRGPSGTPAFYCDPVVGPWDRCAESAGREHWIAWLSKESPESPPTTPTPTGQPADTEARPVIAAEIEKEAENIAAIMMNAETKIKARVVQKIAEDFPKIKEEVKAELLAEVVDIEAEAEERFPPEREKAKQGYKDGLAASLVAAQNTAE